LKVRGVDLKGSDARFAIVSENSGGSVAFEFSPTKKLTIGNDKDTNDIRHFKQSFEAFVLENGFEFFVIRQGAHSGPMAGGATSFKMEAILQLTDICKSCFISPNSVAAYLKINKIPEPEHLLEYQREAFNAATVYLLRARNNAA
jgi:hypothetical protein